MLNLGRKKTECAQKKMEVAIYHWECHQIRKNQPAYDINELSTDKNEKRERKHLNKENCSDSQEI